jgi:cytochrome c-type biogenesis protein CcmF
MIPELGHFALVLALTLALAQSLLPMIGAARNDHALMEAGRSAALGQFTFVAIAFAALMTAYVTSDFSVSNVVENSHSLKPMLYKITGVWGNHEGSLVLWVLMLALFGAAVSLFGNNLPPTLRARVIGVQGMIGLGFLAFTIFTSNPFLRVDPAPIDGNDLNPLLQDPGLAFHPPFLYLGYVGFSVAYAFGVAALIEGRVDAAWARWVRPWTLVAWISLTLGIALGSWWAYYELGWGGWWFWDPVENASFMPWLTGTALLHSAIVVEKRNALKSWTILLAIITFSLSLLGTFIVRSGVLTSVHAFAVDPERGVFILALLVIATGGALALYAIRAPQLKLGGLFAPVSREGALLVNNLFLATACATVFVGTLFPLFMEAATGRMVSVGPPFFNAVFIPLMIPLIAALGIGPLLAWKRGDLAGALGRLKFAAVLTAAIVFIAYYFQSKGPALALVGIALAAWAFFGAITELAERIRLFRIPFADSLARAKALPRSAWGTFIAHAGLGIAVAGMTGTSGWTEERVELLRAGETITVAGYTAELRDVKEVQGPNYLSTMGTVHVTRGGEDVAVLYPERRWYPVANMNTTEAAIHTTWVSDVYVVLGEADATNEGAYVVRLYHHPLVPWIWIGAVIVALGGCVSMSDRRLRVGAPRKPAHAAAAAAGD